MQERQLIFENIEAAILKLTPEDILVLRIPSEDTHDFDVERLRQEMQKYDKHNLVMVLDIDADISVIGQQL
jgi:hypothetical protein